MVKKIFMVTGATSGIGKATALEFARMGERVVLAGRDPVKTRQTVEWMRSESGNPELDCLIADLSSVRQTRALAKEFHSRYGSLHVLVNNAGAVSLSRRETEDGFEYTFALNYLVGRFLLTQLLLDTLQSSAPARVVNVASHYHVNANLQFDDLHARKTYSGLGAYAQAKLADIMFTYELARRLEGTGVTVNALHPGVVGSNFGRTDNPRSILMKAYVQAIKLIGKSVAESAQACAQLATHPGLHGVSGKYFREKHKARSSAASYNTNDHLRLWALSENMLGLKNGISRNGNHVVRNE